MAKTDEEIGVFVTVDDNEFIIETYDTDYYPLVLTVEQAVWLIEKLTEELKKLQGDANG